MTGEPLQPVELTPFGVYLGVACLRRGGGLAEAELELRDHHVNRRGVAHGGVLTSLLDIVLGSAVISSIAPEAWCATVELPTHFVAPARLGRLRARGRLVRRGRRLAFAEGEIVDAHDRVLTTGRGVWNLWSDHPDRSRASGVAPAAEDAEIGRPHRGQ